MPSPAMATKDSVQEGNHRICGQASNISRPVKVILGFPAQRL